MRERGWNVVRVDIEDRFGPGIIVKDARLLKPGDLPLHPDLLWASPPCVDFSVIRRLPARCLHRPPDMSCIDAVFRLVLLLRPRFWVLENAAGLEEYLGLARQRFRWHYLWGGFPLILSDIKSDKGAKHRIGENGRYGTGIPKSMVASLRAKIPYQLSLATATAVEGALVEALGVVRERA